jgi:HEPN domain-containing protein
MAKRQASGVSELAKASIHRLEDARALVEAGRWMGAMYLAGYAVECLLKTKLMRRYRCRNLEELETKLRKRRRIAELSSLFTHSLMTLVDLLECRDRMRTHPDVWGNFTHVNQWKPAWRYWSNPATEEDANDFLAATERVLRWIHANT